MKYARGNKELVKKAFERSARRRPSQPVLPPLPAGQFRENMKLLADTVLDKIGRGSVGEAPAQSKTAGQVTLPDGRCFYGCACATCFGTMNPRVRETYREYKLRTKGANDDSLEVRPVREVQSEAGA